MFPRTNPTSTAAWLALQQHALESKALSIKNLVAQDSNRYDNFSFRFEDIIADFSKNLITAETVKLLIDLAEQCGLKEGITALFGGELINETEQRSVLHVALRNLDDGPM